MVWGLDALDVAGEAIAEWIVDGAPALDLSDISPARLAGNDVDETELRERCRRAYATHYRAGSETSAVSWGVSVRSHFRPAAGQC